LTQGAGRSLISAGTVLVAKDVPAVPASVRR